MKAIVLSVLVIVTGSGVLLAVYNVGWAGGYVQGMVDCRRWVSEGTR